MKKRLVVDSEKCVGCRICEFVCSTVKEGVLNFEKARIKVAKMNEGLYLPVVCKQCESAPCEIVCPVGATTEYEGAIMVSEVLCIGCGFCIVVCPFGAMYMHLEKEIAINCDLCHGRPECIDYCPTGALTFEQIFVTPSRRRKEWASKLVT